jgi:hypothetical protein
MAAMVARHERISPVVLLDTVSQSPVLLPHGCGGHKKHGAKIRIPDSDDATWSQHSPDLPQRLNRLSQVHQHHVGEGSIEGRVGKRQLVDAGNLESAIGHTALYRSRAGLFHLRRLEVDTYHFAWRHDLGKADGDTSGAAADIEQAHAGAQVREEKRSFAGGCSR